jgi:carbonic anhydrase/acetyltransferase-like protein (isoleucine patch superfamily)
MILTYKGKTPVIGKNVFIAPNATIIGDVRIADGASVFYGAIIRGDIEPIVIGENTNIQDNAIIHTDEGFPATIGPNVTVGHNAVVHGCTVEEDCLIGIGAIVLSGAKIYKSSVVGAASVVSEGHEVGPHHLVLGIPARLKKTLAESDMGRFRQSVKNYMKLGANHREMTAIVSE